MSQISFRSDYASAGKGLYHRPSSRDRPQREELRSDTPLPYFDQGRASFSSRARPLQRRVTERPRQMRNPAPTLSSINSRIKARQIQGRPQLLSTPRARKPKPRQQHSFTRTPLSPSISKDRFHAVSKPLDYPRSSSSIYLLADPVHEDPVKDTTDTLAQRLLPGDLKYALPDNWVRDFTWTGLAALNVNLKGQMMPPLDPTAALSSQITSSAFIQPMAAQWVFSTIPMGLLAAAQTYHASRNGNATKEELVKIWTPVVAASLAVPMWDLGQVIGTSIGTTSFAHSALWYGSSIAGGMIAAPFTGMFEGFTQFAVRYIADVATNPMTRAMWRENPALMGKLLAKDLLLNVTIGAIPGAVWQIVWFFALAALVASLPYSWAVILTMLAVATAVMLCNLACTHIINKTSEWIDKKLGWDKELEKLRESLASISLKKLEVDSSPSETAA